MTNNYRRQSHLNEVLKSSCGRLKARTLLQLLCLESDFKRPEVTQSRQQMEQKTGYSRNSIIAALRILKAEGSIVPIRNVAGGRGNAVTYRLQPVGEGVKTPRVNSAGQGQWHLISEKLAATRPSEFGAWVKKLEISEGENKILLIADSDFVATWITNNLLDWIKAVSDSLGFQKEIEICSKSNT